MNGFPSPTSGRVAAERSKVGGAAGKSMEGSKEPHPALPEDGEGKTRRATDDKGLSTRPLAGSSSCRWSRRWRRRCAPAGSPMRAPASSRSSGPKATLRGAMTISSTARAPISCGSIAARKRSCSISCRRGQGRARDGAVEGRRVRAEPQARRGGAARPSASTACAATIRGSITCSVSGYGGSGPYAGRKAYDLLIQAEAGLASVTSGPRHRHGSASPWSTSPPG